MLLPVDPFQGDARMIRVQAPPMEWFVGDRVSFHAVVTEILVASRGDGDVGKGFEASQRVEYRLEGETPLLEELEKWLRMHESSWKRTGCSSFSVSAMTRFRT